MARSPHAFCILTWKQASGHRGVQIFPHPNFKLPKMLRTPHVFNILTWKCPLGHSRVQFSFLLWPHGSSESTFRPSRPTNHWKNIAARLSWLFARLYLLSSDFLAPVSSFFWLYFSLLFSILSDVWLLNFLRLELPPPAPPPPLTPRGGVPVPPNAGSYICMYVIRLNLI